jgi:hypothetical protein
MSVSKMVFLEPEPSKFQCNTCKIKYCYFQPDMAADRGLDVDHPITIPVFISRFGCASHSHIRNETLDEVVELIEGMGHGVEGWGFVVDEINNKLRRRK